MTSLNRNILECKSMSNMMPAIAYAVLIETYWNVNTSLRTHRKRHRMVLIETYWNVNVTVFVVRLSSMES